jgi:hypothetical protein
MRRPPAWPVYRPLILAGVERGRPNARHRNDGAPVSISMVVMKRVERRSRDAEE